MFDGIRKNVPNLGIRLGSLKFDIRKMLCTFSFGCFQIYPNKSAKNIAIYFIGTIVSIKCMPKISAVGLFCLDKFENYQTRTCTTFFRTSNLTEPYFRVAFNLFFRKVLLSNDNEDIYSSGAFYLCSVHSHQGR